MKRAAGNVYNKISHLKQQEKDILGCKLLNGGLRLLLENQSGFTFTRILHHLHPHLFAGREQISHQRVESEEAHKKHGHSTSYN